MDGRMGGWVESCTRAPGRRGVTANGGGRRPSWPVLCQDCLRGQFWCFPPGTTLTGVQPHELELPSHLERLVPREQVRTAACGCAPHTATPPGTTLRAPATSCSQGLRLRLGFRLSEELLTPV